MHNNLARCNVGLRSEVRCVPNLNAPWQTLNQLDASTVRASGQSKRISLMILSRVNVDFLNESYGQWTICPSHRKEYLDAWQVNKVCCHPCHVTSQNDSPQGKHMITDVMAIKILLNEGAVVPISGRICDGCMESYVSKYPSGTGSQSSSSSTNVKSIFTAPSVPIQQYATIQNSKSQISVPPLSPQIISLTSGHAFPVPRVSPAGSLTIIPIPTGTTAPVAQTAFLPNCAVYPNSVTNQSQNATISLPVVVQMSEQPEKEIQARPRLKPTSKSQPLTVPISKEENETKKYKSSRNQTLPTRSENNEEHTPITFWSALNLRKKDLRNEIHEEYHSENSKVTYPISIQMEDTLPNEYSVLNNYRQIFSYHIRRLGGLTPGECDRVRSSVIDAFLPPNKGTMEVPKVQSICRLRRCGTLSRNSRKKMGIESSKKLLGLRPKFKDLSGKKKLFVSSRLLQMKKGKLKPLPIVHLEKDEEDEILSIFSNDSDDDPTWAPSEDPREEVQPKPLKLKQTWKVLLHKKRRKTDSGSRLLNSLTRKKKKQERLDTKEALKRNISERRRIRQEKLKKREERIKAQREALLNLASEKGSNNETQKTDDQMEYHYVCNLCQISFYRETAFRHHMSSKIEYHKELKEKIRTKKDSQGQIVCTVCAMEFKVSVALQIHMAVEHGTGFHPFFCQICNVNLKSESAFKSHNSKLHLERPARTYYCRVCEQLFECRLKHADHILTHQNWPSSEPGMQCKYCGKVFSQFQSLIFHKHLATHDEEEEQTVPQKCTCRKCAQNLPLPHEHKSFDANQETNENNLPEVVDNSVFNPIKRKRRLEAFNVSNKCKKIDEDNHSADLSGEDEEENSGPFQCGICSKTFSESVSLSRHLKQFHQNLSPNGIDSPLEQRTALSRKLVDLNKVVIVKPTEKNWQECVDRNWAAEFGYGKDKPKQLGDILEKMKQKFFTSAGSDDESGRDENEASDEQAKSKKLQGKRQRPVHDAKIPRILSQTSIRSRKRMETLLQRARDFMINETEYEAATSKEESVTDFPAVSATSTIVEPVVEPKIEDEDVQDELASMAPSVKVGEIDNDGDELVDRNIENLPDLCDVADEIMPESKEASKTVSENDLNRSKGETQNRRFECTKRLSDQLSEGPNNLRPVTTRNDQCIQLQEVKEEPEDSYESSATEVNLVKKQNSTVNRRKLRNRNSDNSPVVEISLQTVEIETESKPTLSEGQGSNSLSNDDPNELLANRNTGVAELDEPVNVKSTNNGLLIPLENGWICEKNWSTRTDSYTTHFWSPDGERHPTLGFIQAYARQKKLSLDMEIFRKAIKNNPPKTTSGGSEMRGSVRKTFADMAAKLNGKKSLTSKMIEDAKLP